MGRKRGLAQAPLKEDLLKDADSLASRERSEIGDDGNHESDSELEESNPGCRPACRQDAVAIVFMSFLLALWILLIVDFFRAQYSITIATDIIGWLSTQGIFALIFVFFAFSVAWVLLQGWMLLLCFGIGYIFVEQGDSVFLSVTLGTAVAFVGTTIGALACFGLSKSLLRPWSRHIVANNKTLQSIDLAMLHHGIRVNLLLRLAPVIPSNVLNYGMGATATRTFDYAVGNFGALPGVAIAVYLGAFAEGQDGLKDSITEYLDDLPTWEIWLGACTSIVVGVLLIYWMTSWTRQELISLGSRHQLVEHRPASASVISGVSSGSGGAEP